jgi:hypothetical protein
VHAALAVVQGASAAELANENSKRYINEQNTMRFIGPPFRDAFYFGALK